MYRVVAIVLLFLYLIPNIGINGTVHYCGGEVASVTVNGIGSSEKCECGSMRMDSGCCSDEDFSVQLEEDEHQYAQTVLKIEKSLDFSSAHIPQFFLDFCIPFVQKEGVIAHHPPDIVKTTLYLLHQVFLI